MNSEFHNPTHLTSGAVWISRLVEVADKHGNTALVVTGGGTPERRRGRGGRMLRYRTQPAKLLGRPPMSETDIVEAPKSAL